ncbi:hypothetical protein IMCC26134_13470 [Verrucomicrobia bacterium IMCC26134]|nr:hypothetical protein IMCC26134_13470 [Verrucomicrobia bacterium IMCC26134]
MSSVLSNVGKWWWRDAAARAALTWTLVATKRSVGDSRWEEARAILDYQARRRGRPAEPVAVRRWAELEFRAAAGLRDFAAMEALFARYPELAGLDEEAALLLWRLARASGDDAAAVTIRELWRGSEKMPLAWICAEVDVLWASDRCEEAKSLLAKVTDGSPGSFELPILLRQAMLATDGAARFEELAIAYRIDPMNADLRGLRAILQERTGQTAQARVNYVAALAADPGNQLRRDDLASFYLRQGDLATAVRTWREGLDEKSPDYLWVRVVFWRRMLGVPALDAAEGLPAVRRARFVGWLADLPPDRFWDEKGYLALNLPDAHAQTEPSVFWLRLLEQIRGGDWAGAGDFISSAPTRAASIAPSLLASLRTTVAVRQGKSPADVGLASPGPFPLAGAHRWWWVTAKALRGGREAIAEFTPVAMGPQAASAALLAAGWNGPAVALAGWSSASTLDTPGWIRLGLLEARRMVRGTLDALVWGRTLPEYPETDYAVAALKLSAGRSDAVSDLRQLAADEGATGYAAGLLLATWLMERDHVAEATALVESTPALAAAPEGVALLARAHLAAGRKDEASKLYAPLAEISLEAGAWLAREAFAKGDLDNARWLTEFWLRQYPEDTQLRANLALVVAAQGWN